MHTLKKKSPWQFYVETLQILTDMERCCLHSDKQKVIITINCEMQIHSLLFQVTKYRVTSERREQAAYFQQVTGMSVQEPRAFCI